MRRWISGLVIGIMLASTTVVGAASENITVQDAGQVKFTFNGIQKQVPEGYTVLMYQDRTYVPARFVAESMGGKVDWNQATQTVLISSTSNDRRVESLKLYSRIADQYHDFETIYSMLSIVKDGFDLAFREIDSYGKRDFLDNKLKPAIANVKNALRVEVLDSEALRKQAGGANIYLNDMDQIITLNENSVSNFEQAAQALSDFYYGKTQENFNREMTAEGKAFDAMLSAAYISTAGYHEYMDKVQEN